MKKLIILILLSSLLFGESLRIYTEENPPWNYKEDSQVKGISTQIVRLIQKEIDNGDKIELIPWSRGYNETLTMPNRVLFSTARIPQREELFYWIGPVVSNKIYLYKHKSNPNQFYTLEDAKKAKTIDAGPSTNAAHMALKEKGFANLSTLSREIASLKGLQNQRVELLALAKENLLPKSIQEGVNEDEFENTGIIALEYDLYIVFSKTTKEEIVLKWQNAFEKLQKNGTIEMIVKEELARINNATKN